MLNPAGRTAKRDRAGSGRANLRPCREGELLPATPLRRGLTLVEMLVALVCTLLLMMAYTQLFGDVGARIGDARATIEMSNRMRSAVEKLRDDFEGATAETIPPLRPEAGMGYFEIIEGPLTDSTAATDDPVTDDFDESQFPLGDIDDILMFTVRAKDGPFTGLVNGNPVQSEVAEVVWFLRPSLNPPNNPTDPALDATSPRTYTLYRRVFLVLPNNNRILDSNFSWDDYFLSVHPYQESPADPLYQVPNTLADLTKRENRFAHENDPSHSTRRFPHVTLVDAIMPFGVRFDGTNYFVDSSHPRFGQDVILTNVVGFDVQVWDPTAPVYMTSGTPSVAVAPGDPGFAARAGTPPSYNSADSLGAYVNLGWAQQAYNSIATAPYGSNIPMSPFYSNGHPNSGLVIAGIYTYDTYSFHYEHDGIVQRGTVADQGTDGFDSNGDGVVDDIGERETMPPYPVPLRGIKVRIRCYEPDVREVREVSVYHSFVPE